VHISPAELDCTHALEAESTRTGSKRQFDQQQVNSGTLMAIALSQENPLMKWSGYAKDDPDFDSYLEEIRKFREQMDRRDDHGSDSYSQTS
jgi:hypothetical protein